MGFRGYDLTDILGEKSLLKNCVILFSRYGKHRVLSEPRNGGIKYDYLRDNKCQIKTVSSDVAQFRTEGTDEKT